MISQPPDWQDGDCCYRCRTQFTLVARKHHCRNCGNIFCAKCSSQQIPLPKLNIEKNVRVCDGCHEKLSKDSNVLALAVKQDPSTPSNLANSSTSSSSNSKTNGASPSKLSTGGTKTVSSASAPSEQELKEEEELQLALALSLSETPAKISFPDCRQFEETGASNSKVSSNPVGEQVADNVVTPAPITPISEAVTKAVSQIQQATLESESRKTNSVASLDIHQSVSMPTSSVSDQGQSIQQSDGDREVFRFVTEVQSTTEVFTNRINSCKIRNRPIADEAAIQSLFLKLTDMHAKLLEYIKVYNEERAGLEAIQDKLSQISDARAALDALREEHQEKVRQEAAEAERVRQSQLASKLMLMREKKSQMMQYQRELALQRIQAQEMILRQTPSQVAYQPPSEGIPQQLPTSAPSTSNSYGIPPQQVQAQFQQHHQQQIPSLQQQQPPQQLQIQQQVPSSQQLSIQQLPLQQLPQHQQIPQQLAIPQLPIQQQQIPQQLAISQLPIQQLQIQQMPQLQLQQQLNLVPRPEDDAPLIVFDD